MDPCNLISFSDAITDITAIHNHLPASVKPAIAILTAVSVTSATRLPASATVNLVSLVVTAPTVLRAM